MGSSRRLMAQAVRCALCHRDAGQVLRGVFDRAPDGPPPVAQGGVSCCGHCGGHLVAVPDEPSRYAVDRLPVVQRWARQRPGRKKAP